MKRVASSSFPPVTVILPMRNASSTVIQALESIRKQEYPVHEIILVDNVSTDNSVTIAKEYAKKHPKMNIKVLINYENLLVARSFNRGITAATTPFVALMHSDCAYATAQELSQLINPMVEDPSIIATYGYNETSLSIWNKFSFWEKALFSKAAGKSEPGLVGKADCFRRRELLSIGAYDPVGYGEFGGEDADLYLRLRKIGKVQLTRARTLHLHYLYHDFSLVDLFNKKRATARTYGRLLRVRGFENGLFGTISHLSKPFLALGSLIPGLQLIALPLLVIFPFWYYSRMFVTRATVKDPRIFVLPLIGIALIYYEAFWTIEAFLQPVRKSK